MDSTATPAVTMLTRGVDTATSKVPSVGGLPLHLILILSLSFGLVVFLVIVFGSVHYILQRHRKKVECYRDVEKGTHQPLPKPALSALAEVQNRPILSSSTGTPFQNCSVAPKPGDIGSNRTVGHGNGRNSNGINGELQLPLQTYDPTSQRTIYWR